MLEILPLIAMSSFLFSCFLRLNHGSYLALDRITLTTPHDFIWPRKFASIWLGEIKSGAVVGVY
jgi:hypothetical protein